MLESIHWTLTGAGLISMAMNEFFSMGGYAAFVWPALGLSALVMAILYFQSYRSLTAREAELEALQRETSDETEA